MPHTYFEKINQEKSLSFTFPRYTALMVFSICLVEAIINAASRGGCMYINFIRAVVDEELS